MDKQSIFFLNRSSVANRLSFSVLGKFFAWGPGVILCWMLCHTENAHGQASQSFHGGTMLGMEYNPFRLSFADCDVSKHSFGRSFNRMVPVQKWQGSYNGQWMVPMQGLTWEVKGEHLRFSNMEFLPLHRWAGIGSYQRTLNPWLKWHVGWYGGYNRDIVQHWRSLEQWALLSIWSGHVQTKMEWKGMRSVGDVTVQKGRDRYDSALGMGGKQFQLSTTWARQLYKRVRGRMRLPLVNQQRTQDAGTFVLKASYAQKHFDDWMLSEGPGRFQLKGTSWQSDRVEMSSHSFRLWHMMETTGTYRWPMNQFGLFEMYLGANACTDVGSGVYDQRGWGAGSSIQFYQLDWKFNANLKAWNHRMPQQIIWTAAGPEVYQYQRMHAGIEAEKLWRQHWVWKLQVTSDFQRSKAMEIGPYHRQSWNAASFYFGLTWQAHSSSEWRRNLGR